MACKPEIQLEQTILVLPWNPTIYSHDQCTHDQRQSASARGRSGALQFLTIELQSTKLKNCRAISRLVLTNNLWMK